MSWRVDDDNEWDDEADAADEGEDWSDDEDESTVACPHCGREIYEDSPQCPYCRQYISDEDAPPSRKSWWIILGVLLCLLGILGWIAY